MKTLEQELGNLDKKHAEAVEEARIKHEVLSKLPDVEGYAPPSIHRYKLYGSQGSIHYRMQRYPSIAEGNNPDVALLRRLLEFAPPVETVKHKDGCTSFRPEPESYENSGEYADVDPVLIDMNPSQYGQEITVKWFGLIGADLWIFEVEFPYHNPKVGIPNFRWNRYAGGRGDISSVEFIGFVPKPYGAKYIKWAGGTNKDPGHLTVYWERGHNTDVPALFES